MKKFNKITPEGTKDILFEMCIRDRSMASLDITGETASIDLEVRRDKETIHFEDMAVNTAESSDGKRHIVLDFYVAGQEKTVLTLLQKSDVYKRQVCTHSSL